MVDKLGLFVFAVGSTEPDDDQSCFATSNGRWQLQSPHWDVIDSWVGTEDTLQNARLDALEAQVAAATASATASALQVKVNSLTAISPLHATSVDALFQPSI